MSKKADSKITLSKKLNKVERPQKIHSDRRIVKAQVSIPDIEDVVTKSKYFSPVQTRQQRKDNANLGINKGKEKGLLQIAMKEELKLRAKDNEKVVMKTAKEATVSKDIEWQPENWHKILENIRTMRAKGTAPVDTMGCHKCSDEDCDEKTQRFQKLIALMLSSQTKDATTYEAMQRLKAKELTPESIIKMESELESLLKPVSFYKNKAKYILQTSRILIGKYSGDIPNNVKELIALPGVGPKMAHICMATAWNEVTGIGVDVHVHRIVNRLHWIPKETKEPEQTRLALEAWLPRDMWREVNHLLVGFGQTVCTPLRPRCDDCLNCNICPSANKTWKNKKLHL